MGDEPIDPFSSRRGGTILLGTEPDIQEERFTQTLNEGGPPATEKQQTTQFAVEEEELLPGIPSEKMPVEKTGGGSAVAEVETASPRSPIVRKKTRNQILAENGLGPLPSNAPEINIDVMREYYVDFAQAFGVNEKPEIKNNKKKMYDEMVDVIRQEVSLSN